jgi:hypothetical protein
LKGIGVWKMVGEEIWGILCHSEIELAVATAGKALTTV